MKPRHVLLRALTAGGVAAIGFVFAVKVLRVEPIGAAVGLGIASAAVFSRLVFPTNPD